MGSIIRRVLVLILLLSFVLPIAIQGMPAHWATKEFTGIEASGVQITVYDSPASLELQARLFREAGIPLQPTASLTRYQLITVLVEELQLPALEEHELPDILEYYIDTCDY